MPQPLRYAHFEVLTRSDGSAHFLGQGAMGATFKAIDQNLLSLAVVKVPSVELLANPAARQRFLQEAQMMARLRHPHVANVFYYGDSDSGPFYAMEFCDGPSLHDYVDEHGPLEVQDTFRLAVQAAAALQALDSHELIHRDLKPSNIILTADSNRGAHVKLIDFGVAREGTPADTGGLTHGGFIGTPAFASPEQLLEATHLDSRSDLYSLGAVLWFCLTGSPPFLGSQFEIMFHHVNTEPDWTQLPSMPQASLAVLKRLLAKSAEERYSSPAALVQVLQNLLGIAAATGNTLQLRTSSNDPARSAPAGYEPLNAIGTDEFGKLWRAKDILTGKIVHLREFPPEFSQKQGLILRLQRLAALLRPMEHPRWQRLLHFEQSGSECRLATESISGPTALQLLKAHQQLALKDALPLLTQIAEAMDFAASRGLISMETAPERLPIAVEGWDQLSEADRSALLHRPIATWGQWSVKVCPLRLSNSSQDLALPSDSQAAQAITRLSSDFVQLCYRLLTGQGRNTSSYVPSPLLSEESNDFFERHFTSQRPQTPQTCHTLLRLLCTAEGLPAPQLPEEDSADPYATRIITRKAGATSTSTSATKSPSPTPTPPTSPSVGATSGPDDPTVFTAYGFKALMESDTFMAAAAGTIVSDRMRDLGKRRADLDADAERMREDERLQAERDWVAQERQALEQARQEVANREQERAKRLADEQARVAEQKKQLEQQQILLEEKRREQQRLEQEIQLRAQLDFQKLQEEAKVRESDLQRQRAAVEDALRARELDFQQREKESLKRLEALKHEASELEENVQQEYLTIRQIEVQHSRRVQDEDLAGQVAKERIAEEERKLEEIRQRLDQQAQASVHSKAKDEGKTKSNHNTNRSLLLLAGCIVIILAAAGSAYLVKTKAPNIQNLLGDPEWKALQAERKQAKKSQRWLDLLAWSTSAAQTLQANSEKAEVAQRHLPEIHADADQAITQLIATPQALASLAAAEKTKLQDQLNRVQDWPLSSSRQILNAKLTIPDLCARSRQDEAINEYITVLTAHSDQAATLLPELNTILNSLRTRLDNQQLANIQPIIRKLDRLQTSTSADITPSIKLLSKQLQIADTLRSGNTLDALNLLVDSAQANPTWVKPLQPQATKILAELSKPDLLNTAKTSYRQIRATVETWNVADGHLLLAQLAPDSKTRLQHYELADKSGSPKATALIARSMLDDGLTTNNTLLIDKAISKLRAAANSGNTDAMVQLGEAILAGQGAPENAEEALQLGTRALAKNTPGADFLIGKAHIRLAELTEDSSHYDQARPFLQKAIAAKQPSAHFSLYMTYLNNFVNQPDRALQALEAGAAANDPRCLHTLGIWLQTGIRPTKPDPARAQQLIEKATKLGYKPTTN